MARLASNLRRREGREGGKGGREEEREGDGGTKEDDKEDDPTFLPLNPADEVVSVPQGVLHSGTLKGEDSVQDGIHMGKIDVDAMCALGGHVFVIHIEEGIEEGGEDAGGSGGEGDQGGKRGGAVGEDGVPLSGARARGPLPLSCYTIYSSWSGQYTL